MGYKHKFPPTGQPRALCANIEGGLFFQHFLGYRHKVDFEEWTFKLCTNIGWTVKVDFQVVYKQSNPIHKQIALFVHKKTS